MTSEFWAGIIGALVGAVAGGGVTWLLQHFQSKQDRLERDKASARSLLFKLIHIHSDLSLFHRHVVECDGRAKQLGLEIGWQSFLPIANGPRKVEFTSVEMSYLLGLEKFDLFNDVLSLDALHSSTIDIFGLYATHRLELTDMLPAAMEGMVGSTEINDGLKEIVAPRMVALDDLVQKIRSRSELDAASSQKALIDTNSAIERTLGRKLKVDILEFTNENIK